VTLKKAGKQANKSHNNTALHLRQSFAQNLTGCRAKMQDTPACLQTSNDGLRFFEHLYDFGSKVL